MQGFTEIFVALLLSNVLLISCTVAKQMPYKEVPSLQIEKPKLKICNSANANPELSRKDTIKIPAFSAGPSDEFMKYSDFEFNVHEKPLKTCSDGQRPVPVQSGTVTVADFESDRHYVNIMEFLRYINHIIDNGYLSLGNLENRTARFYSTDQFCISEISGQGNDTTASFEICPDTKQVRPVLPKCCHMGMLFTSKGCLENRNKKWGDVRYMDSKTWNFLSMEEANPVVISPLLDCNNANGKILEFWHADSCNFEFHPVTDNTVAFLGAYRQWEFLSADTEWCIDTTNETATGQEGMVLIHCITNDTSQPSHSTGKSSASVTTLYMVCMYIGLCFHFMTTAVYLITWSKQNIHGKTLCSCTGSLFFMQLFLGTAHLLGILEKQKNKTVCFGNSIGGQYFMIAAFTWVLVLNFDLWRTFRSMRTHSGNSSKRFLAYSVIGWLFPLLVSGISIALDLTYTCRNSRVPVPEFAEHYCFVAPWAQGYYVYYILGVLMVVSYVFAGLTLFALYTFKRDTANVRSNKSAQDQQNILLFLKLSVVMGLTWAFEVISWAATQGDGEKKNHVVWIIFDLYNIFSAILIFIIFVCKKTTLNMLEQSVPKLKGVTAALSKLTTTFSGESSSDNTASTDASGVKTMRSKKSVDEQVPMVQKTN